MRINNILISDYLRNGGKYMKYVLYGTVTIVVFYITFATTQYSNGFGASGFENIIYLIEWATSFILPWIALYWFIRFVKGKEVKS